MLSAPRPSEVVVGSGAALIVGSDNPHGSDYQPFLIQCKIAKIPPTCLMYSVHICFCGSHMIAINLFYTLLANELNVSSRLFGFMFIATVLPNIF